MRFPSRFQYRAVFPFLALLIAVAGFGCASVRMSDHAPDNLFRGGYYDQAADLLKKGYEKQGESGRDSLLYLLDLGLALHSAGRYGESNTVFLKADKLAEIKDYTSLAAETGTLLTSDNIKDYKVEDFENVLINTYLSMNYALMGDHENALVEARRVNRKLYMMVTEGKRKYKQNAFARYLSAILYEADGNWNDAYVDYKNTHDLEPGLPGLGRDLWRMAFLEHNKDDMEEWDEQYHLGDADHAQARMQLPKSGKGEIIVLYENGISPIKRPNPQFRELPKFFPRYNPVPYATVEVIRPSSAGAAYPPPPPPNTPYPPPPGVPPVGAPSDEHLFAMTAPLDNIEATAIENLDEKYGGMIAKKIAGIVAKEAVGYGVAKATDSPLLGFLTKVALYASDQADVRSWNLLPKDLQLARLSVDPGVHVVRVLPTGAAPLHERTVEIKAGQKIFLDFRYMP